MKRTASGQKSEKGEPSDGSSGGGYRYRSPHVPRSAIHKFARQLGERFDPDRIILFGSYAYGKPHPASDVDLLVVMPAANEINEKTDGAMAARGRGGPTRREKPRPGQAATS
ncbi:MAG: nucleotidyltransferase domain-containing protein [Isosphaeraceae bacterium]